MLDKAQQELIDLHGCRALVLAGPGCGKTRILTERVLHAALTHGLEWKDMLCLTFTNRAAREMHSRLEQTLGYVPQELFVGTIHRFCLRFLFENRLLPEDTVIFDEEDRDEYLTETLGLHRAGDRDAFLRAYSQIYQEEHDHPRHVMRRLPRPLADADYEMAEIYRNYKRQHSLVDFDDLLLITYTVLLDIHSDLFSYSRYDWLQVDEVQDMTPLQLGIVHLLLNHGNSTPTAIYLGDEQQAIFTFAGAGGPALEMLKEHCREHVYSLKQNYRSPRHLVELCNELARTWLDIRADFLPEASKGEMPYDGLRTHCAVNEHELMDKAVKEVARWRMLYPDESIAVLTRTNAEADAVSEALNDSGIVNICLSRNDLFRQACFKTLFAHLAVSANPFRRNEWVRLLYYSGATDSLRHGRRILRDLARSGIEPQWIMDTEEPSLIEKANAVLERNIPLVVLDTETTGLNIFEDDIVQIAAMKLVGGRPLKGSEFSVLIRSPRPVPPYLKNGLANPMVEALAMGPVLEPAEALEAFSLYCKGCEGVCGHNLDFDCGILRENFKRYLPGHPLPACLDKEAPRLDTLVLSRLVLPDLRTHTLESMIKHLNLDGVNSHRADEDVYATAQLLEALKPYVSELALGVPALRMSVRLRRVSNRLRGFYAPHRRRALRLMDLSGTDEADGLPAEAERFYNALIERGDLEEIRYFPYLMELITELCASSGSAFREQAATVLPELCSFSESDLYVRGIVREKVSVMTVHRAKGMEMDNVLLFNAGPSWGDRYERAKVWYVALSRAKKRIQLNYLRRPCPIIDTILHHFEQK